MPSTPTTKSQVQAYRFVLRRMQSALVRRDAVMLHDPMRTHSRATVVGVCLAAIGMLGFLVWALLSPSPRPPDSDGIIIGKESGAVYVFIKEPKPVLIPTFNLASARLLLLAQKEQSTPGAEGGNTPVQGAASVEKAVVPDVIPDDQLKDIPRERLTGIINGPQLLPTDSQRITPHWAVCDTYQLDPTLNRPDEENRLRTSVLAGVADLGPELQPNESLLVRSDADEYYLVYRTPQTANRPNDNTVRAKVDMTAAGVTAALRLVTQDARSITTGTLNAIPETPPLVAPNIEGRGESPTFELADLKVGAVFQVDRAGGTDYWVVLRDGIQQVKRATADLIRHAKTVSGEEIARIRPDQINNVPRAQAVIEESTFPAEVPEVLLASNYPVACLGWSLVGEGTNTEEHTAVHVGKVLPMPRDGRGQSYTTIQMNTPGADGPGIQDFFMTPGRAAVVRSSTSRFDMSTGPISLVSDRGVKYGVPDQRTAQALGLANQQPAPDAILRLLPDGASLNTKDVLQSYDSVPAPAGQFPTQAPQAGG